MGGRALATWRWKIQALLSRSALPRGMIADSANWSHGAGLAVVSAVAAAVAKVVVPRFVDLYQWTQHAANFFKRLCTHRRMNHERYLGALHQIGGRIERLEGEMARLEAQLAAWKAPWRVRPAGPATHWEDSSLRSGFPLWAVLDLASLVAGLQGPSSSHWPPA